MKKVVGYVARHLARRPDKDTTDSRWAYSLKNWGHVLRRVKRHRRGHPATALTTTVATDGWFGLDPAFAYSGLSMQIGHKAGMADAREVRGWLPKNQFAVEMDHFAEVIRADRKPHTPGEEGLQDQRIVAAIYEAAATGSVVKMPAMSGLDVTRGPLPNPES